MKSEPNESTQWYLDLLRNLGPLGGWLVDEHPEGYDTDENAALVFSPPLTVERADALDSLFSALYADPTYGTEVETLYLTSLGDVAYIEPNTDAERVILTWPPEGAGTLEGGSYDCIYCDQAIDPRADDYVVFGRSGGEYDDRADETATVAHERCDREAHPERYDEDGEIG